MNETTRNFTLEDAITDVEKRYIAANPKSEAHYQAATQNMPGANTRTTIYKTRKIYCCNIINCLYIIEIFFI